jgi:hypothetical protein
MQIVASRSRAGEEIMQTEQERNDSALRAALYTLAGMTFVLLSLFLFLFNYTNFFRLAAPL